MDLFKTLLSELPFVINDGAFATELEARGCNINDELWSARVLYENPALIRDVHLSYFEAGADIGTSSSYQASVPGFMKKGFTEEESRQLVRDSVGILKDAIRVYRETAPEEQAGRPLIAAAASGPYGAYLANGAEYTGDYGDADRDTIRRFHLERMALLKEGGADILACETIPVLWEAELEAEIARELGIPVWISFSCRDGQHICGGTKIADCAAALAGDENVLAIGVNCTSPRFITSLICEIRDAAGGDKPVIVFPNGGESYDPVSKMWSGRYCAGNFRALAEEWLEAGANIIGGCCRTTPADIRALAELREDLRQADRTGQGEDR